MPISWNEIRHNAVAFSKDWAGAAREDAEAKTFWDEFFKVFGIKRRTVASFEEPVKNLAGNWSYIDLFWKATLLAEHKSRGKSLDKAHAQAMEYIQALKNEGRDDEIPRYVIVSDFARIALHDLEDDQTTEFTLDEFHRCVDNFAFIPGYKQHKLDVEDPINIRAVELLGELHDAIQDGGYAGHDLERLLVRILFCLFAEDTGLFERNAFTLFIENHTKPDGSDLGVQLARLFEVLNTPLDRRQKNLLEELAELPYVNGDLFAESLPFADLNRDMRNRLFACCRFDWSRISPAVFGSLFQSVMESKERRQVGAHYTSERDILKLVRSLFLDELRAEFDKIKGYKDKTQLTAFHKKLGELTFLDPACGCGNFLVVTYRELRLLEIDVLKVLHGQQAALDIHHFSLVDVDAMYGIEINEFPARIAEVALWLVDHQMNQRLSEAFGQYFVRLPLKKSATIKNANALRIDWKDVLPPERCSYVMGNPPFVGKTYMTGEQRADIQLVWGHVQAWGLLDMVCAWYWKAAEYIQTTKVRCAFVSTNSVSQGEQPGIIWGELFERFQLKIHFAHRAFQWDSEARGKAHVHVVIIGFGAFDANNKRLYDYEIDPGQPTLANGPNISPYLVFGNDFALPSRTSPLCKVPQVVNGSKQVDGGFLVLDADERAQILARSPELAPFIRVFMGSEELINGQGRWCLWLGEASPKLLRENPELRRRLEGVQKFRLASKKPKTREGARTPALFGEIRPIRVAYMAIPEVSSERRRYIPIGFFDASVIPSNKLQVVPDATKFHFGVVCSGIHMAWMRQVTGRLESRYSYSAKIVYNNYPWPESPTDKQKADVEAKAQAVLDARAVHMQPIIASTMVRLDESSGGVAPPKCSLADLYDPLTMPANLTKAHADLDRAVDACYRAKPFDSDRERVEFLFALYEKLTAPLTAKVKEPKRTRSRREK